MTIPLFIAMVFDLYHYMYDFHLAGACFNLLHSLLKVAIIFIHTAIGTDDTSNFPGDRGDGVKIVKRSGTTNIAPTDTAITQTTDQGINLDAGYVEFYITVTDTDAGHAIIEVGALGETDVYATLNDDTPTEVFYVGVTGDGTWDVCGMYTVFLYYYHIHSM